MKKLITVTAIFFLTIILSCNKSDVSPPGTSAELKMGGTKHINALIFTNASYYQHSPYYQEERILEFKMHYKTDSNIYRIEEALEYLKNALLTGDTSEGYEHPYAYITNNGGFLDCYPEPDLQASPKFENFRTWFEDIVTDWMAENECTEIAVGENKPKYFVKAHCTVQ